MAYRDSGLPGILFSLLDYGEDGLVIKHAQDTITKTVFLVLHLSELVMMCFLAATSDPDQRRLEGLLTMQVVIDKLN